jgi:hypothetical protein
MTYDQWIKDTHSLIKPRSNSLKELDNAIKARNEFAAKNALKNWINEQNSKKQDWQRSVRNEKGAVKKLYDQLGVLGAAPSFGDSRAASADKEAKDFIKEQQKLATLQLFTGKNLKFKDSFWGIVREKSTEERKKINKIPTVFGVGIKSLPLAKDVGLLARDLNNVITSLMNPVADTPFHSQIIETVLGSSVEEFAGNCAPFLGMTLSGAKAVKAWIAVAQNIYDLDQMNASRTDIRLGDPTAALNAIRGIIDRELTSQKAQAGIRTAAFTSKALFTFADFGTASTAAVGTAEAIVILLNTLAEVVRDAIEMKAGNKLISENKIDLNLFRDCPILGCYYIVVQDHSTIMNFEIENMGRANWQQEAERLKYAIKPVIEKGTELIEKSRIKIDGMEMAKGVYKSTVINKIELFYKSKGYGQAQTMESIKGIF